MVSSLPFTAQTLLDLKRPLGVFDSGVGGLTVLKALRAALPERDFIYLGDTARVPYGRKPQAMVVEFTRQIAAFLISLGVEGVVVGCNTAASAHPRLSEEVNVPVWDVIGPGVEAARRSTRNGQVGVIATGGTISAGAYQSRLAALDLSVWSKACPMFVSLVEEGLADSVEAQILAELYLRDRPQLDTLILGCTHYPMLRAVLSQILGEQVALVDSAEVTAEVVKRALAASIDQQAAHRQKRIGKIVHLVTGDVVAYQHTARTIGGLEGEVFHLDVQELKSEFQFGH